MDTRPQSDISSHATAEETSGWDEKNGKTPNVVTTAVYEESRETRPANRIHWGDAIVDVLVAVLPLYFVGFCVAVYLRDGTLANSYRNQAIFQMSKLVSIRYRSQSKLHELTSTRRIPPSFQFCSH